MKKKQDTFSARYYSNLKEYSEKSDEVFLQRVYEIGREAVESGWGILDFVALHEKSFERLVEERSAEAPIASLIGAGARMLREVLSSFELVHCGLREAIGSLKASSTALADANLQMEKEIQVRKEAEAALHSVNEELLAEIAERKKVEKEVLEISQREQRRFGAELHDNLCQRLVGISMMLHGFFRSAGKPEDLNWIGVERVVKLLNQTAEQAREMAHGFFPVELQGDALMLSLSGLVQRIEKNYKIACEFRCIQPIFISDNNTATHLYRIAQEGINNAVKHSGAKRICVDLSKDDQSILLTVEDDGQGLVPAKPSPFGGIGLQIMKYRARMIDAQLDWENGASGVRLRCAVPLARSGVAAGLAGELLDHRP